MLESKKIQMRQSEIREKMANLQKADKLTDQQKAEIRSLGSEYADNEAKYRAALIAEDADRKAANDALGDNGAANEWRKLIDKFEVRQVVGVLAESGGTLQGQTKEVVQEMRNVGGYRGVPIPLEVLETRAGETKADDVANPVQTRPIIDRLFPGSVMQRMGVQLVNVGAGALEYPIVSSAIQADWTGSETGDVSGPVKYATDERSLAPNHNLGVQVSITRRALKSHGGLETAIRRDLAGTMAAEMDKAVFLGSGSNGQPSGIIAKASSYGIDESGVDGPAEYAKFVSAFADFIVSNAATGPDDIRVLMRPEVFASMDQALFSESAGITEFDRLMARAGIVVMSGNAVSAPAGDPKESKVLLTTVAGGVAPAYLGVWGGVDLIRDPYTEAKSGGVVITAIATADVTAARAEQAHVLTGVQ